MAAKGAREPITLECTECKRRTYMTEKNKKNNTERLEIQSTANSVINVLHIRKQNKNP
mgnify:CR=1 FL=1